MRTFLLKGNVGHSSTGNTQIPTMESTPVDVGKNSKTVYINDNFNLDTIPLDTETIIVVDNSENTI